MPKGADRTWSASVASPSDGGQQAGDGEPGSPSGGLYGCGRTARGTRGTLRTRRVRIGEKGTTPTLSFRSEFSGTTVARAVRSIHAGLPKGHEWPVRGAQITGHNVRIDQQIDFFVGTAA